MRRIQESPRVQICVAHETRKTNNAVLRAQAQKFDGGAGQEIRGGAAAPAAQPCPREEGRRTIVGRSGVETSRRVQASRVNRILKLRRRPRQDSFLDQILDALHASETQKCLARIM